MSGNLTVMQQQQLNNITFVMKKTPAFAGVFLLFYCYFDSLFINSSIWARLVKEITKSPAPPRFSRSLTFAPNVLDRRDSIFDTYTESNVFELKDRLF